MKFSRFVFSLLLCAFAIGAKAQNAAPNRTDKEPPKIENAPEKAPDALKTKAVALVSLAADNAAALKLPENRASVFAAAANLLWETDQKRARALFRRAVEEAQLFQNEDKDDDDDQDIEYKYQLRRGVLGFVARLDARLALALMRETRAPEIAAALSEKPANLAIAAPEDSDDNRADWRSRALMFQASLERDLENYVLMRAFAGDPRLAIKLLREHKNTNAWLAVLPALDKLRRTDLNDASDLANETLQELVNVQPTVNDYNLNYLLVYFAGERRHTADKKLQLKPDLLSKFAANVGAMYLQAKDNQNFYYDLTTVLPILERFLPADAIRKLRAKQEIWRGRQPPEAQLYTALEPYRRSEVTIEKLLIDAAKMPSAQQKMLYSEALHKLMRAKDFAGARQILLDKFESNERENLLVWVQQSEIRDSIEKDRLESARERLAQIKNKNARAPLAAEIARAFERRKPKESHQIALKLLDDARRQIDSTPETEEETRIFLELIGGYAEIEPNTAFQLIEPVIDNFNDLLRAGSIVRKFVKNKHEFRRGEFVTGALDAEFRSFFALHLKNLNKLAAFDFERTSALADKFSRAEVQIAARMLIAESVLQPESDASEHTITITDENNVQIGVGVS